MSHPLELGVCGWCLDRNDPVRAVRLASAELGVRAIQLGFFSKAVLDSVAPQELLHAATEARCTIVGTFLGFESEDYSSIASIAITGGFLPDQFWAERFAAVQQIAAINQELGCPHVGVHVGTLPQEQAGPVWEMLIVRTRQVADHLASSGLSLLLETGREPAGVLVTFIEALERDNVAVSFDPGNLMVYGVDDPVRAVSLLRGRVKLVHLKDAFRSASPGVEYGRRAELGTGDVQIPRVLSKLRATGYTGSVLVEVSGRDGDLTPTRDAVAFVRSMLE